MKCLFTGQNFLCHLKHGPQHQIYIFAAKINPTHEIPSTLARNIRSTPYLANRTHKNQEICIYKSIVFTLGFNWKARVGGPAITSLSFTAEPGFSGVGIRDFFSSSETLLFFIQRQLVYAAPGNMQRRSRPLPQLSFLMAVPALLLSVLNALTYKQYNIIVLPLRSQHKE